MFLHPNIVWRGEGRASCGIQKCILCYIWTFDKLRMWKWRFSITVPRIFVLHCSYGDYDLWVCEPNCAVWPFKWNLFERAFTWYHLPFHFFNFYKVNSKNIGICAILILASSTHTILYFSSGRGWRVKRSDGIIWGKGIQPHQRKLIAKQLHPFPSPHLDHTCNLQCRCNCLH